MFPTVSGNLKAAPCLKAVWSILSDARRAPMPALSLIEVSSYVLGGEKGRGKHKHGSSWVNTTPPKQFHQIHYQTSYRPGSDLCIQSEKL